MNEINCQLSNRAQVGKIGKTAENRKWMFYSNVEAAPVSEFYALHCDRRFK
jgi:hypothetical protein